MGVSKTQTTDLEKKKKRGTKGLKFITLGSKGCFCVCAMSVFYRSLFATSAFSRSVFSSSGKRRPRKRRPCKQRLIKHRHGTNTKTAFARERNEFKALSSSFPFLFLFEVCVFEVCSLRFRGLSFRDTPYNI